MYILYINTFVDWMIKDVNIFVLLFVLSGLMSKLKKVISRTIRINGQSIENGDLLLLLDGMC